MREQPTDKLSLIKSSGGSWGKKSKADEVPVASLTLAMPPIKDVLGDICAFTLLYVLVSLDAPVSIHLCVPALLAMPEAPCC